MKLAPTLAEHEDNISLNQELFKKVDAVYSQQDALGLTREQQRLLERLIRNLSVPAPIFRPTSKPSA